MKKIVYGWMTTYKETLEIHIFTNKGKRSSWLDKHWPPKRINITIEEIKPKRRLKSSKDDFDSPAPFFSPGV